MEGKDFVLKFGSAYFNFRNEGQMKDFLENWCYMDKQGHIFLHHGIEFHAFTKLCKEYYKFIPAKLKFQNRGRTSFMMGRASTMSKDNK